VKASTANELTALADGTLAPDCREPLLRLVSASPRLAWGLAHQMTAVKALRSFDTSAPPELRERLERLIREHAQRDQGRQVR
jgi:anti-sigma factor RsiW